MKRMLLAILAMGCFSCTQDKPEPRAAAGPVIVQVVGRDSTVIARSSGHGPVYTVQSPRGEVLVPPMTMQQLQASHPQMARQVKSMSANLWAGVE